MKTISIAVLMLLLYSVSWSQTYWLNSSSNGQTYITCSATLYDDGGPSAVYSNSQNYEITFHTNGNSCIRAVIEYYDIEEAYDFLYFYDGPNSTYPQINSRVTGYPFVSGTHRNETGNAYYAQSGYITIRFFADGLTVREGFRLKIDCPENCLTPSCLGTTAAGDYCNIPTPICDFNGYCGNTSTNYPTDHDEIDAYNLGIFCGGINNNSWLSFVADSTTAILDVWVYNCQGSPLYAGNPIMGIQLQVYETDCGYANFTPKSNCWSPAKEVNGQIIAAGLTVGNTYLLMIDGFAQDNCEYTFAASSGVIVADAGSDQTICEGESVLLSASGGSSVVWTATPSDPSLSGQETNMTVTVSPSQTTTYTATVAGSNPNCPGTADVVVFVDAADAYFTGLDAVYCENGSPVTLTGSHTGGVFSGSGIAGTTFNPSSLSPGTYNVTYSYNFSVVTAFSDDFDPWPDPGWIHGAGTGTSSWAHGTPQGGDGQNSNIYSNPDPTTDHTSNLDNKVWGQGLSATDGDGLGGHNDSSNEWLKSPAINCSGLSNTVLSFWRYANFETNWDEAYVEISTNGSTFTPLTSEPYYPQDDHWVHRIIDISSWADGQPTVYIRFRSFSDNLQTYSGWNVDDFSITGVQSGGSCVSTDVQQVTINALPDVSAGNNITICAGQTASLNGSITGGTTTGTWSSSGSGSFSSTTSMTPVYTPSAADISFGSATITLTSSDPAGPCGAVSDNLLLTITPMDNASFLFSSGTYCSSGSDPAPTVTLPGGTFTSGPAGLVINSSSGLIDLDASSPQTYTVTYTTNGSCPNSSNASITITNGFDAEFSYAGPYCEGSSNPLPSHSTGSDGTYSSTPAGLVFVSTSTGEINLLSSSPGTYTITNTIPASGGCSQATFNNTVTIDPAPLCSAGSDGTICEGDAFVPSGSMGGSATNVNWSSSGDGSFQNGSTVSPGYTPGAGDIATGSVTLTITTNDPSGPCAPASDNLLLTIHPAATVNAGSDGEICETGVFAVSGASIGGSASSLTWTTSGDGTFDNTGILQPGYTPGANDIASGTVTLTVTTDDPDGAGPCTDATDNLTLTIFTSPAVSAGPDTSICEGGTYLITGASMTGASGVLWTTGGNGSFNDTQILNATYTPGTADVSGGVVILYLTTDDPFGPCNAVSDSLLLKINPLPHLSLSVDSSNCNMNNGQILVLASGGADPYSYEWAPSVGTDSLISNLGPGTYFVTVTDDFGCERDTFATIYDIGAGSLSFNNIENVACYGDSTGIAVAIISGGTPAYLYLWSDGTVSDTLSNAAAGVYSVTITDASNCIVVDSVEITQPSQAIYLITQTDTPECFGDQTGTLSAQAAGGTPPFSYAWEEGSTGMVLLHLPAGNYPVTVTDSHGCIHIETLTVIQPDSISIENTIVMATCAGSGDGSISTSASGGTGSLIFSWASPLVSSDSVVSGLNSGIYTLSVTDENACVKSLNILVESVLEDCLYIPTLFTPNGDSRNDNWQMTGIEYFGEIHIEVYNRWGNKVYIFDGKGTAYAGDPWDGTFNGNIVPFGGYVYIIDLKNGEEPLQGVVTVKQ